MENNIIKIIEEIYQIKNEFKNYISLDELNTLFKGKIKQSSLT